MSAPAGGDAAPPAPSGETELVTYRYVVEDTSAPLANAPVVDDNTHADGAHAAGSAGQLPHSDTNGALPAASPAPQVAAEAADVSPQGKAQTQLPESYLKYLTTLRTAWTDLPDLTITYSKLAYQVSVPKQRQDVIPNLWTSSCDTLRSLNVFRDKKAEMEEFRPLHATSGVVRPGELTLILAPPGHGKSVLLRTLAGRLVREGSAVKGEVRWNGLSAEESAAAGQQINKLTAFVEQGDVHYPMLTVRETFQFALDQSNADVGLLGHAELVKQQQDKVSLMLELLGLNECADTPVGNAFVRGVSGGQRKRVTLGEMMIGQTRALFLDEISTGLDSAATFDIVCALQRWTRVMSGSATVALLQPAPEVLALFDNLILMRHGQVVFQGTRPQLEAHLAKLKITPNEEMDFADWIVDFLTDPPAIWRRDVEKRMERGGRPSAMQSFREEHSHAHMAVPHSLEQMQHELQPIPRELLQVPQPQHPHPHPEVASPSAGTAAVAAATTGAALPPIVSPPLPSPSSASRVADRQGVTVDASKVTFHVEEELGGEEFLQEEEQQQPVEQQQQQAGQQPQQQQAHESKVNTPHVRLQVPGSSNVSNGNNGGVYKKKKSLGRVFRAQDMPPLSTPDLRRAYESSPLFEALKYEIGALNSAFQSASTSAAEPFAPTTLASPRSTFTTAQLFQRHSGSLWHHTRVCLGRQVKFYARSPAFIGPRLFQATLMGLVMGSLFYQLGEGAEDFSPRLGLVLEALIYVSFCNMSEVPLASEFKKVVYKQVDAGWYPTAAYVLSVVIMHFPLALAECTLLGSLIYWMAGFASNAGRYFFWLLVLSLVNIVQSGIFRTIAYACRNLGVALNMAQAVTALSLLFGGFLITSEKIPNFLIEFFWLSPFSWALRSQGLNEFLDARYDFLGERGGKIYLDVWQIDTNWAYKWAGVGYLIGLFFVVLTLCSMALAFKRSPLTVGTRRERNEPGQAQDMHGSFMESAPNANGVAPMGQLPGVAAPGSGGEVRIGVKTSSMIRAHDEAQTLAHAKELAFTRMDLSFMNLRYTVQVPDESRKGKTKDRVLLNGINGFARAGELTALMGSSGAGKTTLMDVLAGRKTAGVVEGQILVNGHPQKFPAFNRLMGFAEQEDIHVGMHTVREAIMFSAKLRLDRSVSKEARTEFVEHILEELELKGIADRIIGDATVEGLAPGELKRVTIGVEMAANPTFLFLDEPTSGLDSRAALVVVRVLRKIASRGRAVVCTIHQPSAELFAHFDRLLLLKSGGREVYFGPVGEDGLAVAAYFTEARLPPGFDQPELPEKTNVAAWMLDCIGAGTAGGKKIPAYETVYAESELRKQNEVEWLRLSSPREGADPPLFDSIYASSYSTQFRTVLHRLFTIYWRDTSYNGTKFFLMLFLGVVFGLVYLQIDDGDQAGMTSKISIIFMTTGTMGVLQASNALPIVFRLRGVFYRERASNTFAPWVYSATLAVVELPYLLMCVTLFTIPYYFLVGFVNSAASFFQYWFVIYLVSIIYSYYGQFLASALPNIQIANIIAGVCWSFMFLFGGVFIQRGVIPTGWQWVYHINPVPKALIAFSVEQFYCDGGVDVCPSITALGGEQITKWEYTATYLNTGRDWQWYYVGWMFFTIALIHCGFALAVQKINHQKR